MKWLGSSTEANHYPVRVRREDLVQSEGSLKCFQNTVDFFFVTSACDAMGPYLGFLANFADILIGLDPTVTLHESPLVDEHPVQYLV